MKTYTDDELIAWHRAGRSLNAFAREHGVARSGVQDRFHRLARKGYSPEHGLTHTVPDGYKVKGVSTMYREDGTVAAQWVKSAADAERQRELMQAAFDAMASELPKLPPRKATGAWNRDLLTAYPIGDPHIGMLSWPDETGEAWDLDIAERIHCGAMAELVSRSPATEQALVVNLGDALHFDSMAPITARSGNILDADGRYAKMVDVAVKTLRQCVESALQRHKHVHVINCIGNHDETGALWLSTALAHLYEREKRVTVERSPSVFNYYRFGENLIGLHHGHTCKADKLPGVMAADRAKDWGECWYRVWWQGHIHHASVMEYQGVSVESFGTLAAKDAYATNGGWRSRREINSIVLRRSGGVEERHTVYARDVEQAAA